MIREHLRDGMQPGKLALGLSVGFLWGTMPMLGLVTILSIASCRLMKLSIPLVLGFTILITPLQAILFIPFQQLGAAWFPISPATTQQMGSMIPFLEKLGTWQIQALEAWGVTMLPAAALLYVTIRAILLLRKKG
jgi:uncharacterized protein (DUF2062 family)